MRRYDRHFLLLVPYPNGSLKGNSPFSITPLHRVQLDARTSQPSGETLQAQRMALWLSLKYVYFVCPSRVLSPVLNSPYKMCFRKLELPIRRTCPADHRSWFLITMASMLVHLASSRTILFVRRSLQLIAIRSLPQNKKVKSDGHLIFFVHMYRRV